MTNGSGKKYVKSLSYFMFFYFGLRLIATPILYFSSAGELMKLLTSQLWFYFNFVISLGLALFGLVCSYYLMKMRKWALISLIVLLVLHTGSILLNSSYLGQTKLPLVQIAALIMLIGAFRYLKK